MEGRKILFLSVSCLFLCFFTSIGKIVYASECNINSNYNEEVNIAWVYDGDTVKLSDGRKIRLVGINTPELDHKSGNHQKYAEQAHQYLKLLLPIGKKSYLTWAKDRQDKYKRGLAYLSLDDGIDIQAELIKKGLAMSIVVEPNDSRLFCYRKLETQARKKKLGIWKQEKYKEIVFQNTKRYKSVKGYRFIKAQVKGLKKHKHSVLLKLTDSFSIYIQNKVSKKYRSMNLKGKVIMVRGWVNKYKGKPQIKLSHEANLIVLN